MRRESPLRNAPRRLCYSSGLDGDEARPERPFHQRISGSCARILPLSRPPFNPASLRSSAIQPPDPDAPPSPHGVKFAGCIVDWMKLAMSCFNCFADDWFKYAMCPLS